MSFDPMKLIRSREWMPECAPTYSRLQTEAEGGCGVVGLAATTTEGQLLRCNETFARFCGYARADDLLTQPDGLVLPLPVDWASFARHLGAASAPVIVESCVQHPDGRIAWLQDKATRPK